jgi:hypothetical protein
VRLRVGYVAGGHAFAYLFTCTRPAQPPLPPEVVGGVEDAFSRLTRVVLRAGEGKVLVEGLVKLLTCHFDDVVTVIRAHAHVRLEKEGAVAVAGGLILASAADTHVLGLGAARRSPLAATPRPGLGATASSPPWTKDVKRSSCSFIPSSFFSESLHA